MKILQLCPRIPYPPVDGGTLGLYNLSKALYLQNAEITVLAFNTSKHFVKDDQISAEYLSTHHLHQVYLDNRPTVLSAIINLFSNQSYHISRFITKDFEEKLVSLLKSNSFDIIQVDYLVMAAYIDVIRKHSNAKVVLRAHNVEYRIWKRLAEIETNILKRKYLFILAKRLQDFETSVLSKVDAIVALTEEEATIFKNMGARQPVCIAPTCFFLDEFIPKDEPAEFSLFHIGAMDWMPNTMGLKWFIKEVWSKVTKSHPQIKLYLAGNKMPKDFFDYNSETFHVEGRVDDAKEFMASHSVMIVPLLAGSGIRVKIVEGMAMGKPIISTSQGAEGLKYENKKNILIADTAEQFYACIIECYQSFELRKSLGNNARELASSHYNMSRVGEKVFQFYKSLI